MAISYPLAFPTHRGLVRTSIKAMNSDALAQSPFTYAQQVQRWPGQMWSAEIELPPMTTVDAETWIGWGLSLYGRSGTFLMGETLKTANRGTAVAGTITGSALSSSPTVTMTGTLLVGDMIQIGTGSDSTLHKVLVNRNGNGVMEIWPALRKTRTAVAMTLTGTPKGLFRLASNTLEWDVSKLSLYGMSFGATEVVG